MDFEEEESSEDFLEKHHVLNTEPYRKFGKSFSDTVFLETFKNKLTTDFDTPLLMTKFYKAPNLNSKTCDDEELYQMFVNHLEDREYPLLEIVDEYREFTNEPITARGFARLKFTIKYFSVKRKVINGETFRIYTKKQ